MTQNLTPSSLASDKPDSYKPDSELSAIDKPSSNEIRSEIDQTRASVGDKIDQLQARLDPNRLKAQAQETVQEMLTDTANSMTEYVKVHKDELITSLADAARRNPLPTALVGLGLGWLILESMTGNRPRQDQSRQSSPDYRRYDERARYARSNNPDYYPPQSDEMYYPTSEWAPPGTQNASGYPYEQPYQSEFDRAEFERENRGYNADYRQEVGPRYGNGHQVGNGNQQGDNPIAKASGAVKDTMGEMGERVSDTVGDLKDRAGDTVSSVGDSISSAAGSVKESVGDAIGGMRQQAGAISHQTQRSFQRAGNQMDQWQQQARDQGQRRGRQMVHHLEDNPLIYGAVAMAAGAAIGFLLPQSGVENRAFGEMRDQVMNKGQEVLESAKIHAQQVVEEVRPELEQTARQIVSDVTETGKQAAKDAAEQLSPIVDKALSKGKQEAISAAKEAGVDPDKLSTTPALNRDSFSGQWKEIKGEVKRKWGQLSDDDITRIEGDYDKLVGSIQNRYGYTREQVEREISDFFNTQNA